VGRLFWKFFILIMLVQLAGMVAVGTAFWLRHQAEDQGRVQAGQPPFPHRPPDMRPGEPPPPPPPDGLHRPPPRRGPFPIEPLIATFFVSLVCAVLLARYFSRPIRSLRDAFDAAASGNLKTRVGDAMGRRRDELADLGHDFDRMADHLSALMDAQRRLLHDVSHELRSPLARLQAAVGLIRQTPEKLESTMDRIERESARIDHLVGELLTLSRLEAGVIAMADEEIPVGELLADIVGDACFEAEANRQQVLLEGSCEATVHGRPELLHRAIENVVRNALKHTPPERRIIVACSLETSRSLRIAVLDEGPGVAEAELSGIFEPFFRGNGAQGIDGHGLGLAIAQRVIQAHGGTIRASNRPDGGLCVEIILPVEARRN
jgi:signal transduction histidine kinase